MKNKERLKLLYSFKGALLKRLFKGLLVITLITVGICLLNLHHNVMNLKVSTALPGYMGAALGLLLVFRNNTAYDKWWEARKEIGGLVNVCRNFAITINGNLPPGNREKISIARLVISFVYCLKDHLRDEFHPSSLKNLEAEEVKIISSATHKPNIVANMIMNKMEKLHKSESLSEMQHYLLVTKINTMIDILGRCERIKNTPIPMAYGFLLKFFINVYVLILPFGLFNDIGWWTIPLVMMLYYILMSIVLTAEEIEEPFGNDLNDLPLNKISINIENNIEEIVSHE
ncbi:MAG TPA: bestrophin family protein [Cytophagaceae bacterium]|jgi:putative membrane protein